MSRRLLPSAPLRNRWSLLALSLAFSCVGEPAPEPAVDITASTPAGAASPAVSTPAAQATLAALAAHGVVGVSVDANGAPRLVRAIGRHEAPHGATIERAARYHLRQLAPAYRLPVEVATTAELVAFHDLGQRGVIAAFDQRIDGIPVYRSELRILMRKDLSLYAIAGSLGTLPPRGGKGGGAFRQPAQAAVASALTDLAGVAVSPGALVERRGGADRAGYLQLDLATAPAGVALARPARAKRIYVPDGDALAPAWFVEIFASVDPAAGRRADSSAQRYLIAADDGRVLDRRDLTAHAAFNYRVWADADARPLDGPQADFTPHPTGLPNGSAPAFIAPALVAMEGFNTNPVGMPDPWLAFGATETNGNNVDAYADRQAPDGFSSGDLRASTTGSATFDRVYDTAQPPSVTTDQTMAAVTQAFYVTNWLHDWYYDSGFDEVAGNAQANNFGRGGQGADPMQVEIQDYSGTNNANMSTPADGSSPRMQLYVWSGAGDRGVHADPSNVDYAAGVASFGAQIFDLTATLVLADDGVSIATDACEPLVNDVAGKIVLVDRVSCTFGTKAANVQNAGGVGMILANNQPGAQPPGMSGTPPQPVNIGSLSITFEAGGELKAALMNGPITTRMHRAADVARDGALDNTLVAHEWTHYLLQRLTDCGALQCMAMGEGWGDFIALHMILREGDPLDGVYATAGYAAAALGDSSYFGIRRTAFSADLAKNGLTFRHISNGEALPSQPLRPSSSPNAEVHNAGEIWTTMLFEAYLDLVATTTVPGSTRTFEEVRRAMSDYVVAGLLLTPTSATYTEQRDAILLAAGAASPADAAVLAGGFAKRGAGSCAVSPARNSTDFVGVVESFEILPQLAIGAASLDSSIRACDADGVLDAEEAGVVRVTILNSGGAALSGASVTVSTTTSGVSFPLGVTASVPDIAAGASGDVTIPIALDASFAPGTQIALTVSATAPSGCTTSDSKDLALDADYDDTVGTSATDKVETAATAWTLDGALTDEVWYREAATATDRHWRGVDRSGISDTRLVSPDLQVSGTASFQMTFTHRYEFEADATTNWDGGVLEFTTDGGMTWADVTSLMIDPGYGGTLSAVAANPLANRLAFVGQNAAWPLADTMTLDFGTLLAGKTVRFRFRIGTDQAVGAHGWEIDDIAFAGIDNLPFGERLADASTCPPIASAGPNQTVASGATVTLDASDSGDPDGETLAFAWSQTAGPAVTLSAPASVTTEFTAPEVSVETVLTFSVTVSDLLGSGSASVDITVLPVEVDAGAPDAGASDPDAGASGPDAGASGPDAGASGPDAGEDSGDDGGCGCQVPAGGGVPSAPLLVLAAIALAIMPRRRRRQPRG